MEHYTMYMHAVLAILAYFTNVSLYFSYMGYRSDAATFSLVSNSEASINILNVRYLQPHIPLPPKKNSK